MVRSCLKQNVPNTDVFKGVVRGEMGVGREEEEEEEEEEEVSRGNALLGRFALISEEEEEEEEEGLSGQEVKEGG
ncbi:hypothetical protein M0802_010281 [Mischocyttarus mexicanus]|nr:hypothetical protein M0802_010281 [Mischocyttarus mexicanus]